MPLPHRPLFFPQALAQPSLPKGTAEHVRRHQLVARGGCGLGLPVPGMVWFMDKMVELDG